MKKGVNEVTISKAIDEFCKYLLSKDTGRYIVKIIHFGSTAKGEASEGSDVDIMVVSSDGKEVRKRVAEAAFEVQTNYGIDIQPVVENLDDIVFISSYFIFNVLSYGREVYSVKKENLKKEACRNLTRLAEEYLDAARDSLKNGHARLAIDAAYNAAELGVKVMLLLKLDDIPGSHGGVVGKFGELYVKSGEMSKTLGRRLNEVLELRNNARYKYQALIGKKEASETINLAESIIELARKKVFADFR